MRKWSQLLPVYTLVVFSTLLSACGGGGGGSTPATPPPPVFIDSDKDGVADADDVMPNDALCSAASDAANGQCLMRTLAGMRLKIIGNAGGKLFLSAEGDALMLYGYDLQTKHFIGRVAISGYTPTAYAYVADHGRVYVADGKGVIHAYSETLVAQVGDFARTTAPASGLAAVGKYLMAQDGSGAWGSHYVFDRQGVQTDRQEWKDPSSQLEWAASTGRLYYFRDHTSPNDLMFDVIDQATGRITSAGETPYHGSYLIQGPIRANASGSKVLLGSGDIYVAPNLNWGGKIPASISDAMWLANDELLVVAPHTKGVKLQRYSTERRLLEELPIASGDLLGMAQQSGKYYLIVKTAEHLDIRSYEPSDDSDGDGVSNLLDKFPLDKTAAVDSDNDGHPDAFLKSYTAADSPTGLTLDAYPSDASCHKLEQGDGVRCNPSLSAPPFVPDLMVDDNQGMVYLYSKTQGRIYRWSALAGNYLAPIAVGMAGISMPQTMALSVSHNRLYLGYSNGQITSIDLSSTAPGAEQPFAATAMGVSGLAAVGKYLLAQDASGAWATHFVFDKAGQLTDSKDWNRYSKFYEWAPNQGRIYFFRDDSSPNDLMFEEVDQSSGKLTASGETPYHGDYSIRGPIRVSLGGGRVVLGTGDVYSTADLRVTASLNLGNQGFKDMQWLEDGSLVGLLSGNARDTWLRIYTPALSLREERTLVGEPIGLYRVGNGVVVFTHVDGKPQFQRFNF